VRAVAGLAEQAVEALGARRLALVPRQADGLEKSARANTFSWLGVSWTR
jgi:hypothetical protein